jgi:hypothetical protein
MQWKNPDGSITEGVVIEDGDGNKITSFSGGGGGGGGTVTQGPAGSAAAPWYVAPGTGVAWTLGGALPAFAATPTFNLGTAPTLAVNWSGQSVAVSNFPATQAVSIASLPALSAGSNVVGGVTQSGGPWTVSWSGQSVAATQSGTWNIGAIASLPALAAGSNTIGAVTQAGGPWTINHTQIAGATLGAATAWGAAPSGNVQGVNANVLALPALPAGSNTVGNVGVNNNPVGSGALATSQASIGTAAAQIVAARAGVAGTGRIAVTLVNAGSATVYFGASGVTTTTGMPLPAGASATLDTQAAIYGIAASGTQTIGVMETF